MNTTRTNEVIKAYEVAKAAHEGQFRWGGKIPYIEHPLAVAEMVNTHLAKVVALLHDVVEDTDVTLEDLKDHGFSPAVLRAIEAMTHRDGEEYYEYIERVATSPTAISVKLADLTHNLSDISTADRYKKNKGMINKYELAKMYLELRLQNMIY